MRVETSSAATSTSGIRPAKSHYVVLDGLRGVASLLVVVFHLFEAFADNNPQKQIINHGYLAVDFFFLLSGFVIAYAYDDRWGTITQWGFYKRRLIRLQPMIVIGSVIGAALFWFQDYSIYPKLHSASTWQVLLVMLVGFTMIPLPKSADIRGWDETYPSISGFRHSEDKDLLASHPTVKPVKLVADAILDVSVRGEIVVDPFMGSGTTLIAAERVGRSACGFEIDPLYCDTIIRRFEALTGEAAVHEKSGATFEALAEQRLGEEEPA